MLLFFSDSFYMDRNKKAIFLIAKGMITVYCYENLKGQI